MANAKVDQSDLPPIQFSIRTLFVLTTLVVIVVAIFGYLHRRDVRWQQQLANEQIQNSATLKKLVADVDAICKKLGRAPHGEGELTSLLGTPMPHVTEYGHQIPIEYEPTGRNSYKLAYYRVAGPGDYSVYDSTQPSAGWMPFCD